MPRANRYGLAGQVCHITHRCHDRALLLRFGRDRDVYRHWLGEGLRRFRVTLLGYCITSNHVHLLAHALDPEPLSALMQLVEGRVAQQYNRRKGRRGAFWEDRFHVTLVDGGEYLVNCLDYIDLNMVRTGVVDHPQEWRWGGYAEIQQAWRGRRLADAEALAQLLGSASLEQTAGLRRRQIAGWLARGSFEREPQWTEAVAVGRREYVEWVASQLQGRQRWQFREEVRLDGQTMWTVRENRPVYG